MEETKRTKLEAKGWKTGTVAEFLGLTQAQSDYVEIKVALTNALRSYRNERNMTQHDLAKKIKSSQSRVAKMEAGDPTVTIDLLLRSILALDIPAPVLLRHLLTELTPNALQSALPANSLGVARHVFYNTLNESAWHSTSTIGATERLVVQFSPLPTSEPADLVASVPSSMAAAVGMKPIPEEEACKKFDA